MVKKEAAEVLEERGREGASRRGREWRWERQAEPGRGGEGKSGSEREVGGSGREEERFGGESRRKKEKTSI